MNEKENGDESPRFSLEVLCSFFDCCTVKYDIGYRTHHTADILVLEDVPSHGYSVSSGLE